MPMSSIKNFVQINKNFFKFQNFTFSILSDNLQWRYISHNARKKRDINIRGQINHVLLIFYKLSINYLTAHFKQTLKNIKQRHMGLDLLTVHLKKISRKRIQVKNNWCLLPNFFDFHHIACNLASNSATKTVAQQSPAKWERKNPL